MQKSLSLNEKYRRIFWKKCRRKGQQAENDKTERVTGLSRRTREEIAKWNQLTALRFQTGGDIRHPRPPFGGHVWGSSPSNHSVIWYYQGRVGAVSAKTVGPNLRQKKCSQKLILYTFFRICCIFFRIWCCTFNRSTTTFMMRLTTIDSIGGAAMVLARVALLTMAGWSERWIVPHLLMTFGGRTMFGHAEVPTQRWRNQRAMVWRRREAKNRRKMRPRHSIPVRMKNLWN